MNAVDFIKKYTIDKARVVVDGAPEWAVSVNFNNGMYYSLREYKRGDTFLYDIKRIIESVDFINKFGVLCYSVATLHAMKECAVHIKIALYLICLKCFLCLCVGGKVML